MKGLGILMLAVFFMAACHSPEAVTEFTGNEATYDLQSGSTYPVTGTITFKERRDGKITAEVQLAGTDGNAKHPVHLHLGDISTPDADVALLLNPVVGKTGRSVTTFSMLANESNIAYAQLTELSACVKIHLGDVGGDRDIILAGGNIGMSFTKAKPSGRTGISVCKSE